ncbi:MAG TPA: hypothetical protein PLD47_07040, partial [Aggregatilineales bacterium]|nr:hypothetical protein [Aggregatilineales bacterium]
MPLNTILSDSYRTFRESVLSTPLSLLHSQSRYRTALLSRLIADDGLRTYYYGMGVDDTDVRTFLAGFIHDISEQMPNFGGRVSQVGMERPDDHPKLLAALIEDVAHLSDEPFVLLIDEFD